MRNGAWGSLNNHARMLRIVCVVGLGLVGACSSDPVTLQCPTGKTCGFTAISGGYEHTCAIYGVVAGSDDDYGQVMCWGENSDGRCGDSSGFGESQARHPLVVADLNDAVAISAGGTQSCALRANGEVVCWGGNRFGELDFVTEDGSFAPVTRTFPPSAAAERVQLAAGGTSAGGTTCARDQNQELWCWGRNHDNQIRTGESEAQDVPFQIQGISDARDVSVAQDYTCAVNDNALLCWGASFGTAPSRIDVPVSEQGSGLLSSNGFMTCLRGDSDIKCFTGFYGPQHVADIVSTPIRGAVAIATGSEHACALRDTSNVVCWGNNANGRLGLGTQADAQDPTNELDLDDVSLTDASGDALTVMQIAAGARHSCAIDSAHDIYCWGDNSRGQLGDGSETSSSTPQLVQLSL